MYSRVLAHAYLVFHTDPSAVRKIVGNNLRKKTDASQMKVFHLHKQNALRTFVELGGLEKREDIIVHTSLFYLPSWMAKR